ICLVTVRPAENPPWAENTTGSCQHGYQAGRWRCASGPLATDSRANSRAAGSAASTCKQVASAGQCLDQRRITKQSGRWSQSMRFYFDRRGAEEAEIALIVRVYGLPVVIQKDEQGSYFHVTLPADWPGSRVETFERAIEVARRTARQKRAREINMLP